MKKVKGFNDYTYDSILENVNINKYQNTIRKFYKSSGVELYNALVYSTSLIVLIKLVQVILEYGEFEIESTINNAVAITIFAVAILTNESKDKTEQLYQYLQNMNIGDDDINKVINQLRNIQSIFKFILKDSEDKIESFIDMLGRTNVLVPFLSIISNQITNNLLNPNLLIGTIKDYQDALGELKFKVFLNRIIRKLDVVTSSTNKFQNKNNIKPLKVNDVFKSPAFKTEDVVLGESIRDKMLPKSEEEIDKIVPKEKRDVIDKCCDFIKDNKKLFSHTSNKPEFYNYNHGPRYTFSFGYANRSYSLYYEPGKYGMFLLLNYNSGDEYQIGGFEDFKDFVTKDILKESISEKLSLDDMTTDVKSKVEKSKKLSKEMKEKILPLIKKAGIHGTTYNKGRVAYLKTPRVPGKSFKGVSIGADKDGFYVMTHRARSKSYPELDQIPNKDINFIKSTG